MGLSLLPIFGYTPKWASRAPGDTEFQFHPPRDVAQFSRFVRQCVGRYKHRVKVWEVWNEPNIGFFHGSAAEYAEMVKAAAVAAKQEDPNCRIAMGCAGVDLDFLQRLYEFGCGPFFDVMSVHPYQWGRQLNDGWMIDKLQACRQLMDRHGDKHKEIWITEIGWSLAEGVTPQDQADLLAQALVTAFSVRERLTSSRNGRRCRRLLIWCQRKDDYRAYPGLPLGFSSFMGGDLSRHIARTLLAQPRIPAFGRRQPQRFSPPAKEDGSVSCGLRRIVPFSGCRIAAESARAD